MSLVKIVATIGPACLDDGILSAFVQAGMGIARLNGAHGDHPWHRKAVAQLRQAVPDIPILLDIPGVKVRIGPLTADRVLQVGERVLLTTRTAPEAGVIPLTQFDVHRHVEAGLELTFDDSNLLVRVVDIINQEIVCETIRAGSISMGKGVHSPGVRLADFVVSNRDKALLSLAGELKIDYVGLSYVDDASQVEAIRALVGPTGPKIISKIETQLGLANLDQIIGVSDALMIDRGDLSMETTYESVAISQKQIIAEANRAACPVIVATQMLHSMIENPFPTKAEVADITAAVLDGASALMLSGETAVGAYPQDAIAVMKKVASVAASFQQSLLDQGASTGTTEVPNAISEAISLICRRLPVTKIIAITKSGYAARVQASFLPRQPIIAVSNDPQAARRFNLLRGVSGVHVDVPFSKTSTDHIPACLEALWRRGLLVEDDLIVVTAVTYPKSGNRMNMIQTHVVSDLRESLAWGEAHAVVHPSIDGREP
jgi:pyruvate kinase